MRTLTLSMYLLLLTHASIEESSDESDHCGQYGFRCVDSDSFQICTYPDLDGQTDAPEIVRKCMDNNLCDEDNPAYCTPRERMEFEITVRPRPKCEKKMFRERSVAGNIFRKMAVPKTSLKLGNSDDSFGFNDDGETDFDTTSTTTAITTENDDFPSFANPKFDCESFGYFADIYNASMYWNCDHQSTGRGFIARHMLCSPGRIFNPVHKECVMIGTTRNTRKHAMRTVLTHYDSDERTKKKGKYFHGTEPDIKFNRKFSCIDRSPGKYPDKTNCRLYHFCLPQRFAPFNELTVLCPDRLAYDDNKETCNRISFERCARRLHPYQNKILFIEVDAIVLQKQKCKQDLRRHNPDCSEYHLCYNDQTVHLKCPDSYRFDENLLSCQPQHLVSCEY